MAATPAPPIPAGLAYSVILNVEGYDTGDPPFPASCALTAHLRDYPSAPTILATLTLGAGLTRIDDDSVQIDLAAAQTALLRNSSAAIDFVRTDVSPPRYTYVQAVIDVITPVTRGV